MRDRSGGTGGSSAAGIAGRIGGRGGSSAVGTGGGMAEKVGILGNGRGWSCSPGMGGGSGGSAIAVRAGAGLQRIQARADLGEGATQFVFLRPQALEEIAVLVRHASP